MSAVIVLRVTTPYYTVQKRARVRRRAPSSHIREIYALGLGGGSRPTGVLVQRWGAVAGSGAQPREIFFTILMDFEAKSAYHTTYRTLLESSHSDVFTVLHANQAPAPL